MNLIVTGAGVGIGFEIAKNLAQKGANVVLNDLYDTLAQNAAQQIRSLGGSCIAVSGDCSQIETIDQLIQTAVNEFGSVTALVANAGITLFGEFLTYPSESVRKVLEVNLFGTFMIVQKFAQQVQKQQSGGSIVMMSSVVGHQAHQNLAVYAMTKAGIEMFAKNLVIELSPLGININCVAPGATLTERTLEDTQYQQTWATITPMAKPATVSDIAEATAFFLSDKAKHITGQSLIVDGGWTAVSPSPYF
jgi:NAD(P)-dependent dehydrogenase (short-subunit alcohol dehydrogenase family)